MTGVIPASMRKAALDIEDKATELIEKAKELRDVADKIEAPAALAALSDRMILALRYARWSKADQAELHAAKAWPTKITLRALIHRGLIDQREVPTTLGAAVLALLDDQKKDA